MQWLDKMDFHTIRIYGSLAIILGCFIFLYPKLLHPVLVTLLGFNAKVEDSRTDDFVPPPLREKMVHNMPAHKADIPEHVKKMRHGPHPGLRAAAAEQAKQTKGSGRGMMGVILPMYAVGIVIYLIYTLYKVFGKNDKKRRDSTSPIKQQAKVSSNSDSHHSDDDEDEMDIRKLQEKLAKTEAEMTKILAAMQSVQMRVGEVVTEPLLESSSSIPKTKVEHSKTISDNQDNEQLKMDREKDGSSESGTESSESYEIVNKSDKEMGSDNTSPSIVETIGFIRSSDQQEEEHEEQEQLMEPAEEVLLDSDDNTEGDSNVRKRRIKKDGEHISA